MLSMVTGSVGFAPNPLDGLIFFVEPARPLAATIVDNAEGLSVVPVRADALRLRGRAAGLGRLPVLRRLVHQAPAAPLHALADMSTHASERTTVATPRRSRRLQAPKLPRPRIPRRDRALLKDEEIVPWCIGDKIGLAAAWFSGLLLCAIAGSIVHLHAGPGTPVREPERIGEHPVVQSTTEITGAPRAATWTRSTAP